jgi:cellulose synthase/poly-beta-1,6-N-acetylglucosamine synthase-like glycosyltransferase
MVVPHLARGPRQVNWSVDRLHMTRPEMSSKSTLSSGQRRALVAMALAAAVGLILAPTVTIIFANAIGTLVYVVVLVYQLVLFRTMLARPVSIAVTDDEARALADEHLPTYTVLVPAYKEGELIVDTIRHLQAIDYPRSLLEVKVLLEADDRATVEAARRALHAEGFEIVIVPPSHPRTKPKACNYGLERSTGSLVTIFDAEDIPDPLQLRRAVVAFARLPGDVACLQARLEFHNVTQNLITRLFSAEYIAWFAGMLPSLGPLRVPVPLGGTSMHIRRSALELADGWDPHNVTEDADLGIRLYRLGRRTALLDSVTQEEANSDFVNWVKQRSRWYKGYLQTWLVHMRDPYRLWQELGAAGFLGFNVIVGGTPLLALLNPCYWTLAALWFLGHSQVIEQLFPPWIYYLAMTCMVLGNSAIVFRTMVAVRASGNPSLALWTLLTPIYWVMMSIAAVRAVIQLIVAPWFWEKTAHGLDLPTASEPLHV